MNLKLLLTLFLLTTSLFSCQSDDKKSPKKIEMHTDAAASCETFWANYAPETDEKVRLLTELLEKNKSFTGENQRFLKSLLEDLERNPNADELLLTIDKTIFPIYRLSEKVVGIKGIINQDGADNRWEGYAKEHQIVKKNFAYQSIDSVGKLVYFPEEFSKLFNDNPPRFNYYSIRHKGTSKVTNLAYMGDDCLSYFHYDISLSEKENKDSLLFGSKFSLNLEWGSFPEIDKAFKSQFSENCLDCPSNYPDQKTFAKLSGIEGVYFTYADSFPTNTKLKRPLRAIVLKKADGAIVTIWISELDLSGCGCK